MIIAVDVSCPSKNPANCYSNFMVECFGRLANNYPQHQFIYFVDSHFDDSVITAKNITVLAISPYSNTALRKYWWHKIKLPALLKKYNASVFVSGNGVGASSGVPQCLIVSKSLRLPAFFKKANSFVALSHFYKEKIVHAYSIPKEKIQVIYPAIPPVFKPIHSKEKEKIKSEITNGVDYFLYTGSTNAKQGLINLLKAFSQFKKWQKSSMQLIIVDKNNLAGKDFLKTLQSYKYKNDVKILSNVPPQDLPLITAAAYAAICLSDYPNFETPVAEAMQCAVPVIAGSIEPIKKIAGDAALYVTYGDVAEMANQMILLYKDEGKRNEMITKGLQQAQQYNWDKAATLLWQSVLKAME